MRARQLIANASLGREARKAIAQAFDSAWAELAPTVSTRADAVEAARLSLANLILALANENIQDPLVLKDEVVRQFKAKRPTAD